MMPGIAPPPAPDFGSDAWLAEQMAGVAERPEWLLEHTTPVNSRQLRERVEAERALELDKSIERELGSARSAKAPVIIFSSIFKVIEVQAPINKPFGIPDGWSFVRVLRSLHHSDRSVLRLLIQEI